MENSKGYVVKNPKIHQLLPTKNHEHPMVRQSQKSGSLAKSKPGPHKPINMKSNVCNSLNCSAQYIGRHD
jgi:hypothetical protein